MALKVENLTYTYPSGDMALRGISFTLEEGHTLALIGPNGAGKTTLLESLNGMLEAKGTLEVFGLPVDKAHITEVRRLVGLLFEDPTDQLFMPTVLEDVAFGPLNYLKDPSEALKRAREALAAVGMADYEERAPHHLSLGQRKRIALATVLALDCRLLVLDDPTNGLDPEGREELMALVTALPLTKLLASHDLELVWELADEVAILSKGQLVAEGPARELLSDEALLRANGLRLPPQARQALFWF